MRYFFDLDGDGGRTQDTVGFECESADEIPRKAMKLLAEVATDPACHTDPYLLTTRVRDEAGNSVYEATLTIKGTRNKPVRPRLSIAASNIKA